MNTIPSKKTTVLIPNTYSSNKDEKIIYVSLNISEVRQIISEDELFILKHRQPKSKLAYKKIGLLLKSKKSAERVRQKYAWLLRKLNMYLTFKLIINIDIYNYKEELPNLVSDFFWSIGKSKIVRKVTAFKKRIKNNKPIKSILESIK